MRKEQLRSRIEVPLRVNQRRTTGVQPNPSAVERVAELEARMATERAEDVRRKKEVESRIGDLRDTLTSMRDKLKRGADERDALRSELAERAVEIDALRRDLDAARDAAAAAAGASTAADLADARDRIVRLTDRLRELESQSPAVAGRSPEDQALIEGEVRRRDQALLVAAERVAGQVKKIASLERRLDNARARIAEIRDALLAEKKGAAEDREHPATRGVDEILAAPDEPEEAPESDSSSWVDADGTVRGDASQGSWVDVDASVSATSESQSASNTAGQWVAVEQEKKKPAEPPTPPTPVHDDRMAGVRVPPRRPAGVEPPSEDTDASVEDRPAPRRPAAQAAEAPPPVVDVERMAGVRVPPRRPTPSATETSLLTAEERGQVRAGTRRPAVVEAPPPSQEIAPPPGAPIALPGMRAEGLATETPLGLRWPAREVESRRPVDVILLQRPITPAETRRIDALLLARHPNLASAIGSGKVGDATFVVFERADGETLEDWVRRAGPVPEKAAVSVALQVARALRQAAFHGCVHGDLSPRSVRVAASGQVQVEDVGVGALFPGPDAPVAAASFASPERLRGSPPPDARSDVYSLGAVLFFLLTGRPPHEGERDQVLRRVAVGSAPDPREHNPQVSADVAKLVLRMTSADPDRRQVTWDQALVDLERLVPGPRSEELRGNWRTRAVRLFSEHPFMVAGIAATPIVVIAAALFLGGAGGPSPRERYEIAVREADVLLGQGDIEGARLLIARFVTDAGDPAVERDAAARMDWLKAK
jgi:hypothetical protein